MQTQNEYEKYCGAVYNAAQRASMAVLVVPAAMADDLGARGLQIVANRALYHSGKLFRPQADTQGGKE